MADEDKQKIEDTYNPSDIELGEIGDLYRKFYRFRDQRAGSFRQMQHETFEEYLRKSRELFWNSTLTKSEDLEAIGLDFSFPFARKEVLDFLGRMTSLKIDPHISGDDMSMFGTKVLQAIYKKYRLKNKDRVEKFWQILYGIMNGTLCCFVYYDGKEVEREYLRKYDPKEGTYKIDKETVKDWDDVRVEIVPIEEMYLNKVWERDIQKQGITIRSQQMEFDDFKNEFGHYENSQYVQPGNRISEDSLYFELLGGTGVTTYNKVQVLRMFDTYKDKHIIAANGVALNMLGKGKNKKVSPNPFHHKSQPYTWSMHEPIDEKLAYGLSLPYKIRDQHKLLNTSYSMLVENELRAIDRPYLTSDIEAPEMIFGQKKVIPVMDTEAYKPAEVHEASSSFYTMMNSLQDTMNSQAQGGSSNVAPSQQPTSAREVIKIEEMKKQSLQNAVTLYYDMLYQEINLVLKTALQFYQTGHYQDEKKKLVRSISLPNFPLTQGGIGRVEVRMKESNLKNSLNLYFEAVNKSLENGETTEIIEVPLKVMNNLYGFFIDDINLEADQPSELEKSQYFEQIIQPMLNVFVPAGVADLSKTYLRYLEKMGEHPSNFTSENAMPQIMQSWGGQYQLPDQQMPSPGQAAMGMAGQQGVGGGQAGGRQQMPMQTGNTNQSTTGTLFGGQSNGGIPQEEYQANQ